MSTNSAVNEWDNDYARVARIASQFRTQGLNKNSSSSGQAEPRQLFQHITRLDESLSTLPLPQSQIKRRRRLLQHLRGHRIESMNANNSGDYRPPSMDGGQPQSQMAMAMQQQDAMMDAEVTNKLAPMVKAVAQ